MSIQETVAVELSPKQIALIEELQAQVVELKQQIIDVAATEALTVGQVYSIQVGKGETSRVLDATLIGQRSRDNGAVEYRFSHGEGFDARFYDLSIQKVVREVPEGTITSAALAKQVSRIETKILNIRAGKVRVRGVIEIQDGGTYNIKVGKGETAGVVPAVLMAQRYDEAGNQEFAFFTGAGFDAKVLILKSNRVVLEGQEPEDDEQDDEQGEGAAE